MDVKALQWELAAFVAERGLESRHTPKSLAMALAGEGGTLLDIFKWLSDDESRQIGRQEREAAAEAIAEIFLHALRLADELGIDVEEAVEKKRAKLGGKAPTAERRVEAPPAPPPPPSPPPAASTERQLRSATRPVPLSGPPSVRPPRQAAHVPDFPRVRQPAAPPAQRTFTSPPPRAATPPSPPPRAAAPPPPPRAAPRPAAPPPPPPPPPPEVEPYADLDIDAVTELVKLLTKRVDDAQSDDPLVRELYDELGTLKRTLYGKTFKRSWIGATLESVRAKLKETTRERVGEVLKARDSMQQIDEILGRD
jgi:NTP pyrophosphatase (non-canonical NTP hydrolase)